MAAVSALRDSTAYDWNAAPSRRRDGSPQRQPGTRRAPLRKVQAQPRTRTRFFTLTQLMMLAMTLVCCGLILYSSMVVTTMTDQAVALRQQMEDLESEATYLKSQQDNVLNLSYVEEVAAGQLGMSKMDKSQMEYIELSNPDQVEISDSGFSLRKITGALRQGLDAVLEYLS